MKRNISFLLCLLIAFSLFTGCAQTDSGENSQNSGTADPIKLVWFTEQQDDVQLERTMKYIVEPFEEKYTNINIEVAPTADYDQVLKIQLSSGAGPDICNMGGPAMTGEYVAGNKIIDLTDYIKKSGLDKVIFPWALDSCKIDDKYYSIPNSYEALLLWYNVDMFNEMGWKVPTNYAELEETCTAIQAESLIPISFGTSNYKAINEQFVSVALACYAGRENVKKALTNEIKWTDPIFNKSITMLNDMWQRGWINDKKSHAISGDDANALFYSQKAPMTMTGTWMLGGFKSEIVDFNYSAVLFPSLNEGVPPTLPLGAGGVFAINAASKFPDESFKFIEFLFTNENTHAQAVADGAQPLPIDIDLDLFPETMSQIDKEIMGILQDGQENIASAGHVMWTYWPPRTRLYMMDNIENIYLNRLTVEQYLEETQKIFETEVAEGNLPVVP